MWWRLLHGCWVARLGDPLRGGSVAPAGRRWDFFARRAPCSAYTYRAPCNTPGTRHQPATPSRAAARCAGRRLHAAMRLNPADIEQIARRVADLMATSQTQPMARFVDAAQLAELLGVERDWVYAHANALGAIRLGGPRGRLRFDLQRVREAWPAATPSGTRRAIGRSRRKRSQAPRGGLIPYESERPNIMSPTLREGSA